MCPEHTTSSAEKENKPKRVTLGEQYLRRCTYCNLSASAPLAFPLSNGKTDRSHTQSIHVVLCVCQEQLLRKKGTTFYIFSSKKKTKKTQKPKQTETNKQKNKPINQTNKQNTHTHKKHQRG